MKIPQINYWLFCFLLLLPSFLKAEAFTIESYHVVLDVQKDGAIKVSEVIDLNFTEDRRGIIRTIPYKYNKTPSPFEKGEQAIRSKSENPFYELVIKSVGVRPDQFTSFTEGNDFKIKIGDPNTFLSGKHQYTIEYLVYGALNEFENHIELNWNLIGTDWSTQIKKASFEIKTSKPEMFSEKDVLLYTGVRGRKEKNAVFNMENTNIRGATSKVLKANEGMSIALRIPKDYFSSIEVPISAYTQTHYIDKHTADITLKKDGSIGVEEVFWLKIKSSIASYRRAIDQQGTRINNDQNVLIRNEKVWFKRSNMKHQTNYRIQRNGAVKYIQLNAIEGVFSDSLKVSLFYDVLGTISEDQSGKEAVLNWQFLNTEVPLNESFITIKADSGIVWNPESIQILGSSSAGFGELDLYDYHYNKEKKQLEASLKKRLTYGQASSISLKIDHASIDWNKIPVEVYLKNYLLKEHEVDVYIEENGEVRFEYFMKAYFEPGISEFDYPLQPQIPNRLDRKNKRYPAYKDLDIRKSGLLRRGFSPLVYDEQTKDTTAYFVVSSSTEMSTVKWPMQDNVQRDSLFYYQYTSYGLLKRKGKKYVLNFPVLPSHDGPTKSGAFRIYLPKKIDAGEVTCQAYILNNQAFLEMKTEPKAIGEISYGTDIIEGRSLNGLKKDETLIVDLEFPKSYLGKQDRNLQWKLFNRNNFSFILAAKCIGGLALLWFLFGRNKKEPMHLRFYPPEGITPAEAGYLWDDKLHKKDLISLVWYWASNGYLSIEELQTGTYVDYKLTRLKHLDKAKEYEKTLFYGIFKDGKNDVKVSDLKFSLNKIMKQAHKELKQYARTNKFYEPGTQGFGCFLKGFGILLIFGLILFVGGAFLERDPSIAIAYFCFMVAVFFFAKHMPKKGPFGAKKYSEIMGFREFMLNTNMEDLDGLVKDDKAYFEKTIPYAIVFGLGHEWANRFNDYLLEKPSWYEGAQHKSGIFNSAFFMRTVIASMHKMKSDFSAVYVAPTNSGGSSYSGGGSSSFGGGGGYSSGGGFGGGGGSSW